LEAITVGLPVVTLPGALMRGRHSTAILRRMGLDAYIAKDLTDYVRLAVTLADAGAQQGARALIADRRGALFGDLTPVRALEAFLEEALAKAYGATAEAAAE
jgi:predicted O-linked N-acetylglucosamine transferase (SPINDLY family)